MIPSILPNEARLKSSNNVNCIYGNRKFWGLRKTFLLVYRSVMLVRTRACSKHISTNYFARARCVYWHFLLRQRIVGDIMLFRPINQMWEQWRHRYSLQSSVGDDGYHSFISAIWKLSAWNWNRTTIVSKQQGGAQAPSPITPLYVCIYIYVCCKFMREYSHHLVCKDSIEFLLVHDAKPT